MIPVGFWKHPTNDLIVVIPVRPDDTITPVLDHNIKMSKYEITHTQFRWIMEFDPPEVI